MKRIVSAITLVFFVAGCDVPKEEPAFDPRVDAVVTRIEALEKASAEASRREELREIVSGIEGIAYLTPGSQGFSVIKSNLEILTISMENVVAYANGSRITLSVGNPMAASLEGMKAEVEWGKVDNANVAINASTKSKVVQFAESFRPGSWTKTDVILEGILPTDLGFVRVRNIELSSIKLSTR